MVFSDGSSKVYKQTIFGGDWGDWLSLAALRKKHIVVDWLCFWILLLVGQHRFAVCWLFADWIHLYTVWHLPWVKVAVYVILYPMLVVVLCRPDPSIVICSGGNVGWGVPWCESYVCHTDQSFKNTIHPLILVWKHSDILLDSDIVHTEDYVWCMTEDKKKIIRNWN